MIRHLIAALLAGTVASGVSATTDPKPFPHVGDLWYDGHFYADSIMYNHTSYGGYKSAQPGYEFNVSIYSPLFSSCTSWTNLPYGYDDCSTAGYTEPSGATTFGVGSYYARYMQSGGATYEARFYFQGGQGFSTDVNVGWQEVQHAFCPGDSPWCMNGVQGGRFATTRWSGGSENFISWSY